MRKKIFMTFLLLAGCLFVSSEAYSAWTQAKGHSYNQMTLSYKGHSYNQMTLSYYYSTAKFQSLHENEDGTSRIGDVYTDPQPKYTSTNVTYYGAYGITDKITASLTVPWKWIYSDDVKEWSGEDKVYGVGDIDLGLRYNLSMNLSMNLFGTGFVTSVDGKVKIPEAYEYGNPFSETSLGDGQYDTALSIVFGKGIGKGYAIVDIGYKYRFENETDVGDFKIAPKMSLRGNISWSQSVGNAEVSDDLIRESFGYSAYAADQDHKIIRDTLGLEASSLNVGVAFAYSITSKIQTVVGYEFVAMGKDAGKGSTYSAAFVYMH
jgi:hypothetical protein